MQVPGYMYRGAVPGTHLIDKNIYFLYQLNTYSVCIFLFYTGNRKKIICKHVVFYNLMLLKPPANAPNAAPPNNDCAALVLAALAIPGSLLA